MIAESFQNDAGEFNPSDWNMKMLGWAVRANFDVSKEVKGGVIEEMDGLLKNPRLKAIVRIKAASIIVAADKNDTGRMAILARQLNRMLPNKVEHTGTVNHDHLHAGTVSIEERREKVDKLLGFLARARGVTVPASDVISLDGSPPGAGIDDGCGPGPISDSGREADGGTLPG